MEMILRASAARVDRQRDRVIRYGGTTMLAQNVRQNFELLYARREMLPLVSGHRTRIFEAIIAGKPEEAREASHRHLAFIEDILLDRSREESRRERSLRRLEQRKN